MSEEESDFVPDPEKIAEIRARYRKMSQEKYKKYYKAGGAGKPEELDWVKGDGDFDVFSFAAWKYDQEWGQFNINIDMDAPLYAYWDQHWYKIIKRAVENFKINNYMSIPLPYYDPLEDLWDEFMERNGKIEYWDWHPDDLFHSGSPRKLYISNLSSFKLVPGMFNHVEYREIRKIEFRKLPSLDEIPCGVFEPLRELRSIEVFNCPIKRIDREAFAKNSKLQILDLDSTEISDFGEVIAAIKDLPMIWSLTVRRHNINKIDLEQLNLLRPEKIRELDLGYTENNIEMFDFNEFVNLRKLSVPIQKFDWKLIKECEKLREISYYGGDDLNRPETEGLLEIYPKLETLSRYKAPKRPEFIRFK